MNNITQLLFNSDNIMSFIFIFLLFIVGMTFIIAVKDSVTEFINYNERKDIVNNFENYIVAFEYYLQKAYPIIYKDRFLVYSIEATKPSTEEYSAGAKAFAGLVLKMMGTNLKDKLIQLFGDEDTLIFNIVEFFNDKFENDTIRSSAVDNLMKTDI